MIATIACAAGIAAAAAFAVALRRRPYICSVFPMGAAPLVHVADGGIAPYRMAWTVLPTDDVLVQFAMPGWAVEDVKEARLSSRTLYVRVDAVRLVRGVPAPHTSFKVAVPNPSRVEEIVVMPLKGNRGRRVPYVSTPVADGVPRQIFL